MTTMRLEKLANECKGGGRSGAMGMKAGQAECGGNRNEIIWIGSDRSGPTNQEPRTQPRLQGGRGGHYRHKTT
jgi:hypothetical protein